MKTVCILGGGASALMCACFCSNNLDVTIIESASKVGKKILATGNGRCNLSNININKNSYNCDITNYLNQFNVKDALNFFSSIGLETYVDDEGRVYPISNSANSVLDCLNNYIKTKNNIEIITDKTFEGINNKNNKYYINLSDETELKFDIVVVAMGNKIDFSKFSNFNIQFNEFVPSLCALKTSKHKNLAGLRVDNVMVTCEDVNFKEKGEILFKEDGISGIVIFNLSAYFSRIKNFNHKVSLDFMPNKTNKELLQFLMDRKEKLKNYKVADFLIGIFNHLLALDIIKKVNLNLDAKIINLTNMQIERIAKLIKNYELSTCGYFDNNQVCCGGVNLDQLSLNLESKKYKGLYFIGENVNVDGVCGGYNLQWAWTSGNIVGRSL